MQCAWYHVLILRKFHNVNDSILSASGQSYSFRPSWEQTQHKITLDQISGTLPYLIGMLNQQPYEMCNVTFLYYIHSKDIWYKASRGVRINRS